MHHQQQQNPMLVPIPASPEKIDLANHEFVVPEKKITSSDQLQIWKSSSTYSEYMKFLVKLQESVQSKSISQTKLRPKFKPWLDLIQSLKDLVDEVKPIEQTMRFGNKAFKTWHEKAMKVRF